MKNNYTSTAAQGWLCPRCHKINAPWTSQCTCFEENDITCKDKITIDKIEINKNPLTGTITTPYYPPYTDVYYTTATSAVDSTIKTGEIKANG